MSHLGGFGPRLLPDTPQPVGQPDIRSLLDIPDGEQRLAYAKSLGARNVEPPLPHSTHLKVKATGRVLPWVDIMAEHRDLVECCDANGNTDPAAWMPDVQDIDPEFEKNLLMIQAQTRLIVQQHAQQYELPAHDGLQNAMTPQPMGYSYDAVAYADIEKLIASIE